MHIGMIMDGNGRWAKMRSLPRSAGHLEGLKSARRIVDAAVELGVQYLTLYVFSTENWKRSETEVNYLMNLLAKKLPGETEHYFKKNVRIRTRGNISALPDNARQGVEYAIKRTESCTGLTVVLAINYGGQDEIVRAVNKFISAHPNEEINVQSIEENLDTPDIPPADIIVRSAGEMRLSNFLLWDSAYAEFLSIQALWPDWGRNELEFILNEYSKRDRKFGGTKE